MFTHTFPKRILAFGLSAAFLFMLSGCKGKIPATEKTDLSIISGGDTYTFSGNDGERTVVGRSAGQIAAEADGDSIESDDSGALHIVKADGTKIALMSGGSCTTTELSGRQTVISSDGTANVNEAGDPAESDIDSANAAKITLNGTTAAVTGNGAAVSGSEIQITAGGVYSISGTLKNGRIVVNAPKHTVQLIFNGINITCQTGSPLFIVHAKQVDLILADGSQNVLTDGKEYAFTDEYSSQEDDEPNACLYSKADLVISGGGSLSVTAKYRNGITSKDTLTISGATLSVTAANHGINGKDALILNHAALTVNSGGDALRSTNDSGEQDEDGQTLGYISMTGCTLDLTSGEDGIQAESTLSVRGGTVSIETTGDADSISAKGLKGGASVSLEGGTYTLSCTDDAIHSNGSVSVRGGSYRINTKDDALHADEVLTVVGGLLNVEDCYEGLEGSSVTVLGGVIRIHASDDGINAAGGADSSGGFRENGKTDDKQWGNRSSDTSGEQPTPPDGMDTSGERPTPPDGMDMSGERPTPPDGMDMSGERPTPPDGMDTSGERPTPPEGMDTSGEQPAQPDGSTSENDTYLITIGGGYTVVYADGDGVDSNGSIVMTGGTLIVYGPTSNGDGALDYENRFTQSGGTLIAVGSSGMAQTPSEIAGRGISVAFDSTLAADSYVAISAGDSDVLVLHLPKNIQHLVYSSPALSKTGSLTVKTGVTAANGSEKDGIVFDGSVSGGTALTTLTLEDGKLSTYGSAGMSGGGRRPNGFGGFGGGNKA